jgi:hypothetical protein
MTVTLRGEAVSYSVGIWAGERLPGGVVYRWEADGGAGGSGFVFLETATRTVRPCTVSGEPIGDLAFKADEGGLSGDAPTVNKAVFARAAAAILKNYLKEGEVPQTAHVYFA